MGINIKSDVTALLSHIHVQLACSLPSTSYHASKQSRFSSNWKLTFVHLSISGSGFWEFSYRVVSSNKVSSILKVFKHKWSKCYWMKIQIGTMHIKPLNNPTELCTSKLLSDPVNQCVWYLLVNKFWLHAY